MTGAIIYLGNALKVLPDSEFHRTIRPQPMDRIGAFLCRRRAPIFGRERSLRMDFAKMHLASASLRLPAAVFLRGGLVGDPQVKPLLRSSDVDCDALEPPLQTALLLGYCRQNPGGLPAFDVSLALAVAHRDEFAHGQVGQGSAGWRKLRGRFLENSHRCRLAQAQITLIQWLLAKLI